jgi:glycosyltransferase involved in cell wall biosynthesis
MKLLMLAQNRLSPRLGGPKSVLGVGEALRSLGCEVTMLGTDDVASALGEAGSAYGDVIASQFDRFLQKDAVHYDVVDYDHNYLPFSRRRYPGSTLMVARSVLLTPHLRRIQLPSDPRLRRRIARCIRWRKYAWSERQSIKRGEKTLREADLINVSNADDVKLLVEELACPADKTVEIPLGISTEAYERLTTVESPSMDSGAIVFVGTFDYRKGCLDLPEILATVRRRIPQATLTLLGARGLYTEEAAIRRFFRPEDQNALEVVMDYAPEDLPAHLEGKEVGVFPSYLEGFGIGIVEMLAAGIPVFAYSVPGPKSILPSAHLSSAGSIERMSEQLVHTLGATVEERRKQTAEARERAASFLWERIGERTLHIYQDHLERLRSKRTHG